MNDDKRNFEIAELMQKAVNERDYGIFNDIMAEKFVDHHPGLGEGIAKRDDYVSALKYFHNALDVRARLNVCFVKESYTVIHGEITGVHRGEFMGKKPTGNKIKWTYIEVYRVAEGVIQERWSLDDMPALLSQLGIELPH